jgi:DNA replication protein DnaC
METITMMTQQETINKMNHMKFYGMAGSFAQRLNNTQHQDLAHEEFVALLIDDEWITRENRKLKRRLRNAKFKVSATLDALDYQIKRGLNKSKMMDLTTLKWLHHHQNIVITGPTGVGKSFIAQALGHHACQGGFASFYIRLSLLLDQLMLERAQGTFARYLAKLKKHDILILDDWGMAPLKPQESQDLLDVIEDRYEIKSTIVTTQLPIKHWHEFIQNDTVADAICDRLIHNSYKIDLKGESVRKIKGEKQQNEENTLTKSST